jgi:linoleoyl-CoA desaturase
MRSPIHFNTKDRPEFFQELRKNVNAYFQQHNISRQANFNMVFKTGFMICLYFIPLGILLSGVVSATWVMFLLWGIMGLGMTGLGLAVTHDANHHAYSRNKHINNTLGFMLNFIGGFHINWKIQHNMLHHSYTNIDGHDEDIVTPVMRFSPNQENKKMYRFQAYYASFFYAIMSLYWLTYRDFSLLARYSKRDFLSKFKLNKNTGLLQILANKLGYVGLHLVQALFDLMRDRDRVLTRLFGDDKRNGRFTI